MDVPENRELVEWKLDEDYQKGLAFGSEYGLDFGVVDYDPDFWEEDDDYQRLKAKLAGSVSE